MMLATRSLPTVSGRVFVRPARTLRSTSRVICQAKMYGKQEVGIHQHAVQEKTGGSEASKEIYESTEKVVADLKNKWDSTDEKPVVIVLAVVALVGLWVLNGVATALESLPLFSGLFQLVGIFVTGWFTYRYLVFAPDREELKGNIDKFVAKVQGGKWN